MTIAITSFARSANFDGPPMFLSLAQITHSLQKLSGLHPFFGISFLAFKEESIPIGSTTEIVFSQIADNILVKHYRAARSFQGFYIPFSTSDTSNRWRRPRYGSTSLQRITTDTFGDALLHSKKTSEWGWRPDYIGRLRDHLGEGRIPAFDLAVWLFRQTSWGEGTSRELVRDVFFRMYKMNEEEIDTLFDTTLPDSPREWLSERPIDDSDLFPIIGWPPGSTPEEGAALRFLELSEIGPATLFRYEPSERLNIITGDNSLGKTFIFECIWWALTGDWLAYAAVPRSDVAKTKPRISFGLSTSRGRTQDFSAEFDWDKQRWKGISKRETLPGLVVYARFDGSFAVWDPARAAALDQGVKGSGLPARLFLTRRDIWNGLKAETPEKERWLCNGLIRDWVTWQTGGERYKEHYDALVASLKALSPSGPEALTPGEPIRLYIEDAREFPTLHMPYGDVAAVHASAAVQRIIALAYVLVWAWHEHLASSSIMRRKPQRKLVFMIDEIEAHLHPLWQRIIVPAVMDVMGRLASSLSPQVHLATHSPLVMASAEPVFDPAVDNLHHLKLEGRDVLLEELPFTKRGRADLWLMSDVFGLEQPRSLPAENAIKEAKALQDASEVTSEAVRAVNERLIKFLAPDDDFWPRWRFFARKHATD